MCEHNNALTLEDYCKKYGLDLNDSKTKEAYERWLESVNKVSINDSIKGKQQLFD
jgi:hypothetical protein